MSFRNDNGNKVLHPITSDGRTGFDQFNQLMSWTEPDSEGYTTGRPIRDVRGCTCYICGKGWELTTEALLDQTTIDYKMTAHASCLFGYRKVAEYYLLQNALIEAGYLFQMTEMEPQYPHSTPWQTITILSAGKDRADTGRRLSLGRRKRVWEIRFDGSYEQVKRIELLFNDVDDTKGISVAGIENTHFYVHAWTKEQLVDYLRRFRETIPNTDRNTV